MSATAASAVSFIVAKVYFMPRGTGVAGNFRDSGPRVTIADD
jgi:hypothetical protein